MDTRLMTPDGHNIAAIHKSRGASRVVLLCHGITAEKNEGGLYTSFAQALAEHGLDSFRFDFRGHGESSINSADASIAGMVIDLDTVLSRLSEHYITVDIVAASFGASIVLLLAQHTPRRTRPNTRSIRCKEKALVGNRPNRVEPRATKRRPKPHRLLTKPRAEARLELLAGAST